jgi:hypothetical protein
VELAVTTVAELVALAEQAAVTTALVTRAAPAALEA